MRVNFNNARKQALYAYARVCAKLNASQDGEGEIHIEVEDLQKDMDDLRQCLFGIACVYEEGNDDFKDVSEEVGEIECFGDSEGWD